MTTLALSPETPRTGLPVGTVTFLFTDIEGSTKQVLARGAAGWAPILERHRTILREAIAPAGTEILTEGDSFFVVFRTAQDGVAAAVAAQRGLAAEKWPIEEGVRVRMGLHAGHGELDEDGSYIGPDVHRAARIAGAAHGGQVLISDSVRALAAKSLPSGVSVADRGEHRLKDLQPERLFELRIDGLSGDFPPIRSLDSHPNNLPNQLTSFVGRDHELQTVTGLLRTGRLLTLTGPGGTGKTRLSLQLAAAAADDFPDGVWFVPLEPIHDRDLVASTIGRTFGLGFTNNRPALEIVVDWIANRTILIVLDNFEQVADAAPLVAGLLRACPNLKVIATSRVPLRISGEQEYEVPGLPAPPDFTRMSRLERENLPAELRNPAVASIGHYEAVRLFIARATAVRPDFTVTNDNAPAVAQICARLNGMPLAIELAAVRVKLMPPGQILDRLEHQLKTLTSGSRDLPPRQQTLRGAIAWSYDLLDEPQRRFMNALSVFSGGWDLDAAEAVCPFGNDAMEVLEGLSSLVDHSLIRRREVGSEMRFELFPTIREYAQEQLAARPDDDAAMRARHARYYLRLVEEAAAKLSGDDQRQWLDRLEREHDNIRAALAWAASVPEPEIAVRIGFAIWRFWQMRGYLQEGRMRLDAIEAKAWPLSPVWQARLLEALGGITYWQADYPATVRHYERALALWREAGDEAEIANAIYNRAFTDILPIMHGTEGAEYDPGEADRLLRLCEEALALYRKVGNRVGEANILWGIGGLRYFLGDAEGAADLLSQSLAIFHAEGDRRMEAWANHMLALAYLRLRRNDEARRAARDSLVHFHRAGDLSGVAMVLDDLSISAIVDNDFQRAGRLRGAADRLQRTTGAHLVAHVESGYEKITGVRVQTALSSADVERIRGRRGSTSLDEAVHYALDAASPDKLT